MPTAHPLDHKIPPPIVGVLVAAVMWASSRLGPEVDVPLVARGIVVGLLVAAGLAFDLAGLLAFRARRTTVNPMRPQRTSALVTGGVYRLTRNPMYVGMALLLTAWAVHLGTPLPFVGIVLFVVYITRFQIEPEERALSALFGDEFTAYCRRVRRWL